MNTETSNGDLMPSHQKISWLFIVPRLYYQCLCTDFQFGLVGHFWFAAGMCIQIFLFAIVVAEIRIKAPGAKNLFTGMNIAYTKIINEKQSQANKIN